MIAWIPYATGDTWIPVAVVAVSFGVAYAMVLLWERWRP